MKTLILTLLLCPVFAEEPKSAPTVAELQEQIKIKDSEIVRLNALVQAVREQLQAQGSFFVAQEKVRQIEAAKAPDKQPETGKK